MGGETDLDSGVGPLALECCACDGAEARAERKRSFDGAEFGQDRSEKLHERDVCVQVLHHAPQSLKVCERVL